MRSLRRVSLLLGLVLAVVWITWRGPHVADEVRYALATPWPGAEINAAADGTVELDGRLIVVSGGMGVDCMPGVVPIPIPRPACSEPGMSARLLAKGATPPRDLPRMVHARVESDGAVWETDLIEAQRYYDATFDTQYVTATAQRERPQWQGGRIIRPTIWLDLGGKLIRIVLPPAPISVAL